MERRERVKAEEIRRLLIAYDRASKKLPTSGKGSAEMKEASDTLLKLLRGMGYSVVRTSHRGERDEDETEEEYDGDDGKVPPHTQLHVLKSLEKHRKESDERYAWKNVQTIVYTLLALTAAAIVTWLWKRVLP